MSTNIELRAEPNESDLRQLVLAFFGLARSLREVRVTT